MNKPFFVFCGSSELSLGALTELKNKDILPSVIITRPDRPAGRKMVMTETCVSQWARENNITCIKPEKISEALLLLTEYEKEYFEKNKSENKSICLVVSYGKILPQKFLDLFTLGVWNVHPSDLPLYRGPSPIASQIVDGVSAIPVCLMKMDIGMDSGDILEKSIFKFDYKNIPLENSTKFMENLELELGKIGGKSFANNYEKIISGSYTLIKQNHDEATFTKFIEKSDGDVTTITNKLKLENSTDAKNKIYQIWLAYNTWPGCYFFHIYKKDDEQINMRVKISLMKWDTESDSPEILKLIPEGKKEITIKEFESAFGKIF